MGTRSTTTVYEITSGSTLPALKALKGLVKIYRQMDGYPSGMGKDIANFIKNMTVVNGFGNGERMGTHANGAGCFSAQLIKHLKTGIGSIYIVPVNRDTEEYNYHIYVGAADKWATPPKGSQIFVRVIADKNKQVFFGTSAEFAVWVDEPEGDEDDA